MTGESIYTRVIIACDTVYIRTTASRTCRPNIRKNGVNPVEGCTLYRQDKVSYILWSQSDGSSPTVVDSICPATNVLLKRSTLHCIVGNKGSCGSCVPEAIYTALVLTPIQIVFPDLNAVVRVVRSGKILNQFLGCCGAS